MAVGDARQEASAERIRFKMRLRGKIVGGLRRKARGLRPEV
jgi:hypothetical protein